MNQSEAERLCRKRFERNLTHMAERMMDVQQLANMIPGNWFSSAASEVHQMYIAGHFYGALSVAQAYVERLGKFIAMRRGIPVHKDPKAMWPRLVEHGIITQSSCYSALATWAGRHDFHHLNEPVEQDPDLLRDRARATVLALHAIEDEVYGYTFADGAIVLKHPEYWDPIPDNPGTVRVEMRSLL